MFIIFIECFELLLTIPGHVPGSGVHFIGYNTAIFVFCCLRLGASFSVPLLLIGGCLPIKSVFLVESVYLDFAFFKHV